MAAPAPLSVVPPERWNDKALDQLAEMVRALGPTAGQVIQAAAAVTAIKEDVGDFKQWIREVEARLGGRIDKLETIMATEADKRRSDRWKVVLAVIAGCFTILAAVAAAIVTVHGR